jgi:PEGA domain
VTPDSSAKTVAAFRGKPAAVATVPGREDATFEFASETKPADGAPQGAGARTSPVVIKVKNFAMIAVALVVGAVIVAGGVWAAMALPTQAQQVGSLNVESDPPGAEVRIDDAVRGTTPLTVTVPEGNHTVVVQSGANVKQFDVQVTPGTARAYHIAWAEAPPAAVAAAQTGSLSVVSDPPGSTVIIDGTARGQTPVTIRELSAGRHDVLVRSSSATYQRSVQVEAGATASLVVGGAPATTPSWGWITLSTPFNVQVFEAGRMVGTSEIDRIMLPPGNRDLEFVADSLGFRQSLRVSISPGRAAPVSLTIPRVAMNINALPWAEVYIDGIRIGDTPLANVIQPIGDHEIVFRHPQLGEKRQVTRVTARDSLRVSVDMRAR